jgi:general stress protein 26
MGRRHLLALGIVLAAMVTVRAAPQTPTRDAIIAAAEKVMQGARYATFITLDGAGAPQARIVDPFPPEEDLVVWIATRGVTRKVVQIEEDPRVSLLYFDAGTSSYVTLVGTAAIVRDPAEKAKRWKDAWASFYKDKNQGDDYTLIKVTPSRLEISSQAQGMRNDPVTWQPVILKLR